MHYVCKGESPDFFESEKVKKSFRDDPAWNNLHCKTNLRFHLINEQNQLCIYCERQIDKNNTHIEHILAQTDNPQLRFNYDNLVVSCNGDQCKPIVKDSYKPEDVQSCGHKKDDDLDIDKFLNPIEDIDINDYFSYDKIKCTICCSGKDGIKADYTIDLLNLDNPRLNNERANARSALEKALGKTKDLKHKKLKIHFLLAKKDRAFTSFLNDYFKPFIQ
jgi:uncharacterized protein (TIGR02646 family)